MNWSPDRLHPSAVSDGDELEKDVVFAWTVAAVAGVLALPLVLLVAPALWIRGRARGSR